MWTSQGGNNNNNSNEVSCSPSKSSSISSSPSPSSSIISNSNPSAGKCMEEVWKDINLASLHDHPNNNNHTLQDFLARPFNKQNPLPIITAPSSSPENTIFLAPLAPPFPTKLSLMSDLPNPQLQTTQTHATVTTSTHSFVSSLHSPFNVLGSSSLLPSYSKKRAQENGDTSTDRRHKRMIKNRESAARSRARKQASFSLYLFQPFTVFGTSKAVVYIWFFFFFNFIMKWCCWLFYFCFFSQYI